MLVPRHTPLSDSSVATHADNITFLTESSWSVITSPSTLLTNLVRSSVTSANVTSTWGPKRDPLYIVVPITVIYAVILLTGLVGNVSTCVVIARNKHMHTATNYYLFSLAVSDLLLLVSGLPQEMYCIWSRYPYVFGEVFCVLQGFAAETSANATVLTITAFTVERYVAICHPFQSHTLSKLSRAVRLILAIWLLAMGLAVPQALQFGIVYEQLPDGRVLHDHTVCAIKRVVIPHSFEVSSFVFFVAPMTLISVLYALIGLQLRRSSLRSGGSSVRLKTGVGGCSPQPKPADGRKNFSKNAQIKATKHVVKMLVAVVVAFFICWAPFHAQRLLAVYGDGNRDEAPSAAMVTVYHALTYTSGVLYYLSTTVNPVLYHIMSHKFREAFKDTLARYLGRRRSRGGRWQCYSVLSGRHSNTSNASNCGAGSLRRYLEDDMARLHESRRPIVVSFRRRHTQQQDSNGDSELSGGSTSTGPETYFSMEELTKNSCRFNSRKISKLKKTRNKLNETYLSVICRHSKPIPRGVRGGKSTKENSEKEDAYAGFTPSSKSSLTCSLKHDNHTESFLVPAWYKNKNTSCLPADTIVKIAKECSVMNKDRSGSCNPSTEYPKVEDIEIFQEEHLKIQSSFKKRQRQSRHNRQHAKKHKARMSPSNSIESSFIESGDRVNFRSGAVRSDTANTINGTSHSTVPRSSTLPSLRTVTKDCDTHAMVLSVPSLRHTPVFEKRYDILNRKSLADEEYKVNSTTQFSRNETNRKYLHFGTLVSNGISKSEPNIKSGTARLREENLNLNDVKVAARSKLDYLSNNVTNNTVTNGAKSSFGRENKFLLQDGEKDTIKLSLPEFLHVEKEVFNEKTGRHVQPETDEEHKSPKQSHFSLSPKDNNLAVQNLSPVRVEGRNTRTSDSSSDENSVTLDEFRKHMANTGKRNSANSTLVCNSRPKSCSDLTVSACISARRNCESFISAAYSSSPRLTACDLAV